MDDFARQVYQVVTRIPTGKVMTYGDVAFAAGKPRAARAVGRILHNNPDSSTIPCHRVVFSTGELADAYAFGGMDVQKRLLQSEGVLFLQNGKVNLHLCRFAYDQSVP